VKTGTWSRPGVNGGGVCAWRARPAAAGRLSYRCARPRQRPSAARPLESAGADGGRNFALRGGRSRALEIVVNLLTTDAVHGVPGTPAVIVGLAVPTIFVRSGESIRAAQCHRGVRPASCSTRPGLSSPEQTPQAERGAMLAARSASSAAASGLSL